MPTTVSGCLLAEKKIYFCQNDWVTEFVGHESRSKGGKGRRSDSRMSEAVRGFPPQAEELSQAAQGYLILVTAFPVVPTVV